MLCLWDHSVTIATPPKTGSTSLVKWMIEKDKVAYRELPRHGISSHPEDFREQHLVVRHPVERWDSMWRFSHKHFTQGRTQSGARFAKDIWSYADWFFSGENYTKDQWWWLVPQATYWELGNCTHYFDMSQLEPPYPYGLTSKMPRTNRNCKCPPSPLPRKIIERVEEWAEPDLRLFGYEV